MSKKLFFTSLAVCFALSPLYASAEPSKQMQEKIAIEMQEKLSREQEKLSEEEYIYDDHENDVHQEMHVHDDGTMHHEIHVHHKGRVHQKGRVYKELHMPHKGKQHFKKKSTSTKLLGRTMMPSTGLDARRIDR